MSHVKPVSSRASPEPEATSAPRIDRMIPDNTQILDINTVTRTLCSPHPFERGDLGQSYESEL